MNPDQPTNPSPPVEPITSTGPYTPPPAQPASGSPSSGGSDPLKKRDEVQAKASEKREELGAMAQQKRQELSEKAGAVKEQIKEKTGAAAENLKASGENYAHGKKDAAAERIDRLGEEIDEAAESFERNDPNIAWLTHRAADQLTGLAGHLRDRDFRGLWNDAEDLARKHPLAFMGGMFAAGVAIGSFVRSARSEHDSFDDDDAPYADSYASENLSAEEELLATPGGVPSSSGTEFPGDPSASAYRG